MDGKTVGKAKLKVDSGSEANLMPLQQYKKLYPDKFNSNGLPLMRFITESEAVLSAYGGTVIKHKGKVSLPCQYKGKKFMCTFYLSDKEGPILLGLPASEALGIIKINVESVKVNYIPPDMPMAERPPIKSKEHLREMYPECFTNGPDNAFPDYEYHVSTDRNVKPVIHSTRRLPIELRDEVKKELDRMVARGAIAKVDVPTKWVNSMVIAKRANGRVRICLDPHDLNKAVQREHYAPPILQDIIHQLNGSDTFTKLDAKDGYWHIKLDEQSSYLTTFNTPWGRYRLLVMPFGLNVAQDIFQMKIDETYEDCAGVLGIADDINVHGKGEVQHDANAHDAMEATRRSNISLNYDKVVFKQPSIKLN